MTGYDHTLLVLIFLHQPPDTWQKATYSGKALLWLTVGGFTVHHGWGGHHSGMAWS